MERPHPLQVDLPGVTRMSAAQQNNGAEKPCSRDSGPGRGHTTVTNIACNAARSPRVSLGEAKVLDGLCYLVVTRPLVSQATDIADSARRGLGRYPA
jgi:hypothetical protein